MIIIEKRNIGDIIIIHKANRKVKNKQLKEVIFMTVLYAALAIAGIYGLYRFDIWLQN